MSEPLRGATPTGPKKEGSAKERSHCPPQELETVAKKIEEALTPEDLFGPLVTPESAMRDAIALTYRATVKVIHPDHFIDTLGFDRAQKAFRRVTELKDQAIRKVDAKTYGQRDVAAPEVKPMSPVVIETKRRRYSLGEVLYKGDLSDLYQCSWACDEKHPMTLGTTHHSGLLKIVRSSADNDLAENEGKMLEKIGLDKMPTEKVHLLFPRLYDSFALKGKGGTRRVLVLGHYPEHVSLHDIMKAYPDGIDYRDAAWMWKRMLYAVGYAHRRGVIHGGVSPDHVLVHPKEHGAKLVDWTGAVISGHVKVVSKNWRDLYPPEVTAKKPASAATDIFMLSRSVAMLLGSKDRLLGFPDKVPGQISSFLQACLLPAQGRRPDDAWKLHEDLDELLLQLVGKPRYREFKMPTAANQPKGT